MRNTGLKNEISVGKILMSGSLAINPKNEAGVYTFDNKSDNSGLIFGKLTNPIYNEDELLKVVDTEIFELIPPPPTEVEDTVPRRIYNPVTQSVIDLTAEVTQLNKEISDLRAKVTELEIVTESLRIDVDRESLSAAVAQNEAFQYGFRIQSNVTDLQNAIQKATSEAIQRVSLTARVSSLEEQNREYKEQLEGKAAKLAEGAKVGMDISVKVLKKTKESGDDILFNTRPGTDKGLVNWINGPDIEIYNFGSEPTSVSFEISGELKEAVVTPATFNLEAKSKKVIFVTTNRDKVRDIKSGRDKLFKGSFIAKTTTSNVTLTIGMQLQRGAKYEGE